MHKLNKTFNKEIATEKQNKTKHRSPRVEKYNQTEEFKSFKS